MTQATSYHALVKFQVDCRMIRMVATLMLTLVTHLQILELR